MLEELKKYINESGVDTYKYSSYPSVATGKFFSWKKISQFDSEEYKTIESSPMMSGWEKEVSAHVLGTLGNIVAVQLYLKGYGEDGNSSIFAFHNLSTGETQMLKC